MQRIVEILNLPKTICHHAIGHHHSPHHRMIAGAGIMCVGVLVAKSAALVSPHWFIVHVTVDIIGYAIHGVGTIPFVEYLLSEDK